jgi:hypothetical protein
MPPWTFLLLTGAFAYAIAPFALLLWALEAPRSRRPWPHTLALGAIVGWVGFTLAATLTSTFSFGLYLRAHAVLTAAAAVVWVVRRIRMRSAPRFLADLRATDLAAVGIVLLALGVRLVPLITGGDSLGGNDARFHNILSQKILVEGRLTGTWAPVAPVTVVYPRGVHVLCAFMARIAGAPVHQAFNALFPLAAALTTALVFALGRSVFRSRAAGLVSAACYAFLPRWGSLDYFRWGGLPNAVGMLFLCAVLWMVFRQATTARGSLGWAAAAGFTVVAIGMVHHYSLLVTAVVLPAGLLFSTSREMRRAMLRTLLAAVVLASPLLVWRYLRFTGRIGTTSVLVFREPGLTLWDCIRSLNPVFVVVFAIALLALRATAWDDRRVIVFSWFAALLSAFVFLEYVYRGASLLLTGGRDFFTALTPSRMATDLAYPMAVLCGGLAGARFWRRWPRVSAAVLAVVALGTCAWVWREQAGTGVVPDEVREAGLWIREHAPADSMVIGGFPHLAYLTWRETGSPPLPASEPRNDPRITWRRDIRSPAAWLQWSSRTGRPLFFVLPGAVTPPPPLRRVFAKDGVGVWRFGAERAAGGSGS